jgi:hypothetical protein
MTSIDTLKEKAITAAQECSEAARRLSERHRPGSAEYRAAAQDLPSRDVRCGAITARALVPQNRTSYRRPHWRIEYRMNGKRVSEATALAALTAA